MTTTATKQSFQPDSDVHITFEDQQRINKFARHNAKAEDLKEELRNKTNELENIHDAVTEISLLDEDDMIPILVGEVFVYQNYENTHNSLLEAQRKIMEDITSIKERTQEISEAMSDLKTQLYAKFGNQINLDDE